MDPVQFHKCLAEETRLKSLLLILAEGELCVCELTEALELSQPKISRHLALLRENQLLLDRRQGQWVYYSLHPQLPNWAKSALEETAKGAVTFLQDCHSKLRKMDNFTRCC